MNDSIILKLYQNTEFFFFFTEKGSYGLVCNNF